MSNRSEGRFENRRYPQTSGIRLYTLGVPKGHKVQLIEHKGWEKCSITFLSTTLKLGGRFHSKRTKQ
ncbi:hypothetical protein [Crocosphaera chwakensis]|uniref:hypothetical protein n=1 Tax=Crocosphaera chwakensis TaxID=2546361 RepID=UPI0012F8276D|nr:hypothetical protein [Crocosphaera chwakensis]